MKKSIYVTGIVKDSKNNIEKYLFSENERLNAIIDDLEEKRKYDLCFINHLKEDKKQLQQRIDKAIKYIKDHYNLATKEEGVAFFILRDNLLEILGDKENE
ncbi:MAG: hypothetical protein J6S85_04645 [Methanobrevibacter sp.]|nr:hypothetical protein [Methanobrevibacter sp.]